MTLKLSLKLILYLVHVECEELEPRPVPVRGQRVRHQLLVADELLLAKLAHALRGSRRLFLHGNDGEVLGLHFVLFPPSIWPPGPPGIKDLILPNPLKLHVSKYNKFR